MMLELYGLLVEPQFNGQITHQLNEFFVYLFVIQEVFWLV